MTHSDLDQLFSQHSSLTFAGIPKDAQGAFIARAVEKNDVPIILVTHTDREMESLADALRFFAPKRNVTTFPAWDCLPYDRSSPSPAIISQRVQLLCQLASGALSAPIIVTTINAFMQKLPPKEIMEAAQLTLNCGDSFSETTLTQFLINNGYVRRSKVMEAGEYAIRGGIIDLFPPGQEEAVRIDLFGDEIESIALLDPFSQRSGASLSSITLTPVNEILFTEESVERFRKGYRDRFGAKVREDTLYESISESIPYAGMEHWLPLFYERCDALLDYAQNAIVFRDYQIAESYQDRLDLLHDYYEARQEALENNKLDDSPYRPIEPELLYCLSEASFPNHRRADLSPFRAPEGAEHTVSINWQALPVFAKPGNDSLQERVEHAAIYMKERNAEGATILITASSAGAQQRIMGMLAQHSIAPTIIENSLQLSKPAIYITPLPLTQGAVCDGLILITETDLLGERVIRTRKKKRAPSEVFMQEAAAFDVGELVVHKEHGIGRFDGLITLEAAGAKHDCVKLLYAGEDKLFLPVENIELIARFGSDEEGSQLDKLGGASWQSRKAKMKQRIKMAADELLKIAAKRALKKGTQLAPAPDDMADFTSHFPYEPTDDQHQAIEDTLNDMASGTSMDRLICGDVGFGKTEVALRAAFAAVADGENPAQVAVVVPTTLLARQHYLEFAERFKDTAFTVRQLSRLSSPKGQKETHEMLADGRCDIVIGTHALLAEKVKFKNLGLLVVDEEQRFGVKQKERLKKLRANVHILTLSATPIPRTLQLSLSGVRELSLITTPPVDRLAVRSFTLPFDGVTIREAIMREIHRGGQVFYVTPRVKYIAELHVKLKELVPDIRICIAHGQMSASELDSIINEFYEGKYDLLLSTTIIESGIDIPNANTMILDHSELFGLAQLYQLRGRVGRGKQRAYCYFTLPPKKSLTDGAMKRLEVMQKLDSLGAGFALASHDMDIRGFGNLLGEEQSGHVREVGVELYQQMLEDAIAKAKDGVIDDDGEIAQDNDWSPTINLGISALIPEHYVEDIALRMGLYRRLGTFKTEEDIDDFAAELADRFGALPREVEQLLSILRLKQLCRTANVERLDAGPKGVVFQFRNHDFSAPEKLFAMVQNTPNKYKIRPDQKFVLTKQFKNMKERTAEVSATLQALVEMVG